MLFANQFTYTGEFHKEYCFDYYFKRVSAMEGRIINLSILLFCAVVWIFSDMFTVPGLVLSYLVVAGIICAMKMIRYKRAVKARCRQEMAGSTEMKTAVTCDRVITYDVNRQIKEEFPFDKIKKVVKTKNFIFLITEAQLYIAFKKDGFVKGTSEEFLSFLFKKGYRC